MADSILSVISRAEAKAQGLTRYFTGKPCVHGHIAERLVSACGCCACSALRVTTAADRKKAAELSKAYHAKNRDVVLEKMKVRNKAYYQKNREKIISAAGNYQSENKQKRNTYKSAWSTRRAKTDPQFAAVLLMRKLASRACERIKSDRKENARTAEKLGYSAAELKTHVERQFLRGMSWGNHGEWHLDHILPISSFDLLRPEQCKAANCLSNLRPMWAKDNLKKSDSILTLV